MFKRIDHVEIVPRDIEATLDFYTRILNFKIRERKKVDAAPLQEVVYLDLNDSTIELLSVKDAEVRPPAEWPVGYRTIALEVADMDEAIAFLKTRGIAITWGPVDMGDFTRAEIKDPDGLPIELRQW